MDKCIYIYICIHTYHVYIHIYTKGSQAMGVVSNNLVRARFAPDSLQVRSLMSTDVQTVFPGTPLAPL